MSNKREFAFKINLCSRQLINTGQISSQTDFKLTFHCQRQDYSVFQWMAGNSSFHSSIKRPLDHNVSLCLLQLRNWCCCGLHLHCISISSLALRTDCRSCGRPSGCRARCHSSSIHWSRCLSAPHWTTLQRWWTQMNKQHDTVLAHASRILFRHGQITVQESYEAC